VLFCHHAPLGVIVHVVHAVVDNHLTVDDTLLFI